MNFLKSRKCEDYITVNPPFGLNFESMTTKQAEENFQWFISNIPNRMAYFTSRCASDLKVSPTKLDYTAESLVLVWKWFLQNAQMEKTPKQELQKMEAGAKLFGESFINQERFTMQTELILWDISMYVGQCFVQNHKSLFWDYEKSKGAKLRLSVTANQPIIAGFIVTFMQYSGAGFFAPIHMVGVQASHIFDGTQSENDLQNVFLHWERYINNSPQ